MLNPLLYIVLRLISLYEWVVIAWTVLGLLIYFRIVNPHQPFVRRVNEVLSKLVEPVLKYIQRYVPNVGGIDFSPMILIIILQFIEYLLIYSFARM